MRLTVGDGLNTLIDTYFLNIDRNQSEETSVAVRVQNKQLRESTGDSPPIERLPHSGVVRIPSTSDLQVA